MELFITCYSGELAFKDEANHIILVGGRTYKRKLDHYILTDPQGQVGEVILEPRKKFISFTDTYQVFYRGQYWTVDRFTKKPKKWGVHFVGTIDGDLYEIYFHKGNEVSFFKNDVQFAMLADPYYSFGAHKLQVIADDDIDKLLLCSLLCCVLYSTAGSSGFTIRMRIACPEQRPFNTEWRPKVCY